MKVYLSKLIKFRFSIFFRHPVASHIKYMALSYDNNQGHSLSGILPLNMRLRNFDKKE